MTEKDTNNVKSITDLNKKRDGEIIDLMSQILEMAKNGEIADIAIIAKVRGEDVTEMIWDTGDRLQLIGGLEVLKAEIVDSFLDIDEEEGED